MAVPEIYSKILRKLSDKTQKGEVDWKSTSEENTFVVNFKEFSLVTKQYYDGQEQEEYVTFRLLDPMGKTIDSFRIGEHHVEWGTSYLNCTMVPAGRL